MGRPAGGGGVPRRCPHANIRVNEVVDGTIVCRAHDAGFALDDGAVTRGPAETGLTPAPFTVEGDRVVVSMP